MIKDNFWFDKNVLITGISGFVGRAVATFLIKEGANVTGIVKNINNHNNNLLQNCNIMLGDITDYQFMRQVINENEIDIIFHFAAYSIVRISAKDPLNAYAVNVMGTVALLEAARNVGRCTNIIVASSDKAYGDHKKLPYKENSHYLIPNNTYDTSKAAMDMISRSYAKNYDMPIIVTRSANIYGPGDLNFSRIIPNTIRRLLHKEKPILYSDVKQCLREFVYIDDVVSAYDLLARSTNLFGEAFNIGGIDAIEMQDLIELIAEIMGINLEIEIIKRDSLFKEIERQYLDFSKLANATGWKPTIKLSEGLLKTVNWYRGLFFKN